MLETLPKALSIRLFVQVFIVLKTCGICFLKMMGVIQVFSGFGLD